MNCLPDSPRVREKKRRQEKSFILTNTHASTASFPSNRVIWDSWKLLKVLLGVLWVRGACLLHGVRVYWCQVFATGKVFMRGQTHCLVCRDNFPTPLPSLNYTDLYWVTTLSSSISHLHLYSVHTLVKHTLPGALTSPILVSTRKHASRWDRTFTSCHLGRERGILLQGCFVVHISFM